MRGLLVFLILILSVFSISVNAGLGEEVSGSSAFHQVCIIDRSFERDQYLDFCTGILIDSKTIMTASHCVEDEKPFEIKCVTSEVPIASSQTRVQRHPEYGEVDVDNTQYPKRDIALIHLQGGIPASPVERMSLSDIPSTDRCAFFGYSKMAFHDKNSQAPIVKGWEVSQNVLDWFFREENIIGAKGLLSPGALLEVGDSGGPLMCESDGQWKLLGINSSRDFSYNSLFAAAMDEDLLEDEFLPTKWLGDKAQTRVFQIQKDIAIEEVDEILKDLDRLEDELRNLNSLKRSLVRKQENILTSKNRGALRELISDVQSLQLDALRNLAVEQTVLGLESYSVLETLEGGEFMSTGDLEYNYVKIKSPGPLPDTYIVDLRVIGPSNNFSCKGEILCRSIILEDVLVRLDDVRLEKFEKMSFE